MTKVPNPKGEKVSVVRNGKVQGIIVDVFEKEIEAVIK